MPADKDEALPKTGAPHKPWRRHLARWTLIVLAVTTIGAALVIYLAPKFLEVRIERRIGREWGTYCEIDDLDVVWAGLTIDIHGLHFDDGERLKVDIPRMEVALSWGDLVVGTVRPAVVIHEPVVAFRSKPAPERSPSEQGLAEFESVEVVGGSLSIELPTVPEPTVLDLVDVGLRIAPHDGGGSVPLMDLGAEIRARVGQRGKLHAHGSLSSKNPGEAWSFEFGVEAFELAPLNRLWSQIIEMDLEGGVLGVRGHLTRSPERLRGRVQPRFSDIVVLGAEEDARHPMAEALFGHMLMGARSTIPIDRAMTEGSNSSLPELLDSDWKTIIGQLIRKGYARRLSTLHGFRATIGDVQVDFAKGLLQLFDVVVDAEDPVIDIPLITIARVDVVFDEEVTDARARAYKHVVLHEPTLTFATGVAGADNQIQFDESWLDTISALPFATRDLVVHGGRIDVWDLRGEPVNIQVGDIELQGNEMARDLHRSGTRGASLSATGTVLGEARVSLQLVYEPKSAAPNVALSAYLEPLALTTLAPALQVFVGVDAVGGQVGFTVNLDARDHNVKASIIPDVREPRLHSMHGYRLRHLLLAKALRRLRGRLVEFEYTVGPGDGLLHEFFPALIEGVFFAR
jgi:hypothetical protein